MLPFALTGSSDGGSPVLFRLPRATGRGACIVPRGARYVLRYAAPESSAFGFVLWVSRLRVSRATPPPSSGRHAPFRPDGLIRWRLPRPLPAAEGNRKRSLYCAARRAVCIALRCTRVLSLRLRPLGEPLARLTGYAPTEL